MQTWVYIQSEAGLFTVGFYAPDGTWHQDSDYKADAQGRAAAAARCNYLNGGRANA